jgi:hypothetical protein
VPPSEQDIATFIRQNSSYDPTDTKGEDENRDFTEKTMKSAQMAALFIGKMFSNKKEDASESVVACGAAGGHAISTTGSFSDQQHQQPISQQQRQSLNQHHTYQQHFKQADTRMNPKQEKKQCNESERLDMQDRDASRQAVKNSVRSVQFEATPSSAPGMGAGAASPQTSPRSQHIVSPGGSSMRSDGGKALREDGKALPFRGTEPEHKEPSKREQLEEWLAKKMEALLNEYMLGNTKVEGRVSEEEKLRQIYDERTIAMEISLLYRGFQSIGNALCRAVIYTFT